MPILRVLDRLRLVVEQFENIPNAPIARIVQNSAQCATVDYTGIVLENQSYIVAMAANNLPNSAVPQIDGNLRSRHAALGKRSIAPGRITRSHFRGIGSQAFHKDDVETHFHEVLLHMTTSVAFRAIDSQHKDWHVACAAGGRIHDGRSRCSSRAKGTRPLKDGSSVQLGSHPTFSRRCLQIMQH